MNNGAGKKAIATEAKMKEISAGDIYDTGEIDGAAEKNALVDFMQTQLTGKRKIFPEAADAQ